MFCSEEAERISIHPGIRTASENLKQFDKTPPPGFDKQDIFKLKNHLKNFITVPVYGYNSSRYDLAIIFDLIVQVFDEAGIQRKDVNLLKKGTSYFSCSFGNLQGSPKFYLSDVIGPLSQDLDV